MQSPIAGFCEVLKEVKRKADCYKPNNEAQTREALIDPILEALGWNLSDSKEAELEKHYTSKYIDYVLKGDREIIIEAKRLGSDLSNDKSFEQVFTYARQVSAKSVFLTDGLVWRHYTDKNTDNDEVDGIYFTTDREPTINLGKCNDDDLLIKAAAYFIANLDSALYVKKPKADESDNLKSRVAELEKTIREIRNQPGLIISPPPSDSPPSPPWCILNDTISWSPAKKKPKQLWLPDNQIKDVTSWAQLLSSVCEYTLELKPELFANLPICDRAGASKYLLSIDRPSHNCEELTIEGQKVYLNKTYSAPESVANAVHMLEKLGTGTAGKAAILLQNE